MTRYSGNVSGAAAYYNDADVADFYRLCWGGEDIHIGKYDTGDETVAEASSAMTGYLLDLADIKSGESVIDLACGYGGTLRMLARRGCRVKGIDISEVCVEEARRLNNEAGLDDRIEVEIGDFHSIESGQATWDAAICQESIIHSSDRPKVFSEVFRVLKPDGRFAFSDILTAEGANLENVRAAFSRLGADSGSTPEDYRSMAEQVGFEIRHMEQRQRDIHIHYSKLGNLLNSSVPGLKPEADKSIAASIERWQYALDQNDITWACFVAVKPYHPT